MKFLVVLALTACSALAIPLGDDLPEEYHEGRIEPRFIQTFNTAVDFFKNNRNRNLTENLKSGASVMADLALNFVLNPVGAMFAKNGIGLAGVGLSAGSDFLENALKNHSLSNNTFVQKLLDGADNLGDLMGKYGNAEKVLDNIEVAKELMAGNMTLEKGLAKAGVNFVENRLKSTRDNAIAAATTLEFMGGLMNGLGKQMDYLASTPTNERIDNVLSKIGADKVLDSTFNAINKAFDINLQDTIATKINEIDQSNAPMREKIASIGSLLDKVGVVVEGLAGTAADFGTSSITEYPTIFKESLKNLGVL